MMPRLLAIAAALGGLLLAHPALGKKPVPEELEGVDVDNRLGETIDTSLSFTDHEGREVTLEESFDGEQPVLLTLNYFRCTTLCSMQLNELTKALKNMDLTAGEDGFRILTVSFDPGDDTVVASGKRESYLEELGRGQDVDWTFLTGDQDAIAKLTGQLGYHYSYDEESEQYAHSPVVYVLSPDGKIARYLFGLTYSPRDLRFAIVEASEGKVGNAFDKIILSCFHYVSSEGKYTPFAFGFMRIGAALVLLAMAIFLVFHWRRDKRRAKHHLAESTS
ncbi:MAG: SCO family protein [Myxococcota bacterium]